MRVLNLYAGAGGNRKPWKDVKVVAVEIDREIAEIYQMLFPDDEVLITDAHEFLRENYRDFDFIWSSPPCPSHSRARFWAAKGERLKAVYPDMRLWQEIIFLKNYAKMPWVVENVVSYYEPLIHPRVQIGRHYFWSNFRIVEMKYTKKYKKDDLKELARMYGFNYNIFKKIKADKRRKIIRNMVDPEIGLWILRQLTAITLDDFLHGRVSLGERDAPYLEVEQERPQGRPPEEVRV